MREDDPIYNLIGDKINPERILLTQEQSALSLVLSKRGEHAYLIIESLDGDNRFQASEAHLGTADDKHAMISFMDTNITRLEDIALNNKSSTWSINRAEKDRLIAAITTDQKYYSENKVCYVKAGGAKIVGFFGHTLDQVGSREAKETSIEKNHDSLLDHGASAKSVHDVVDALLHKGINCAQWVKEKVKATIGDRYIETPWERMLECIVYHPKAVVNKSTCLIL